ncbi:MAG: SET domain-containing protein-lysine N-methyltransferase [Thermodesulfobacteriota bacterium]
MEKGFSRDGFELRGSAGKGEGIFATRSFNAGETVMVGIIEKVLEKNHSHASQVGENEYVLHAGSISKVNHCCDPNCGIRVNETGAHDFVAIRDIIVDEEVTFDYAMRNYGVAYFPKECICGSEKCRGRITGWKDLPDGRKNEYEGFVAPYFHELDARSSTE